VVIITTTTIYNWRHNNPCCYNGAL